MASSGCDTRHTRSEKARHPPAGQSRCKDRRRHDISRPTRGGGTDAQRIARFEELWDELFARVLGYALRRTDPEEARDVVAETFTVAWRRLEDVPAGTDALPWLLATARKQLANRRRRDAIRAAHLATTIAASPPSPSSDASGRDPADTVADRAELSAAFALLSADDRETLALIAWDGLEPREAAVVQGCSAATFAVRAHRARRRLAALLRTADGRSGSGVDEHGAATHAPGHGANRQPAERRDAQEGRR